VYVPTLAVEVLTGNKDGQTPSINLEVRINVTTES
jgi:hypothetical protein